MASTSAPPATGRSGTRWWHDPLLVSASVSSLVLFVWGVSGRAYLPVAAANSWVTITVFEAVQAVIALDIVRLAGRAHPARPCYLLVASGASAFAVGGVLQIDLAVRRPYDRAVAVGLPPKNALVAAGAALLIAALVTSPLDLSTPGRRLRFWLDGGTVLIAVTVYAAGFAGPGRPGHGTDHAGSLPGALGQTLVGPTVLLTVAFCACNVLLGGTPLFTYQAGLLMAGATALGGISMVLAEPLYAAGLVPLLLSLVVLANLALLAALRLQQLEARTNPDVWRPQEHPSLNLLPYLAVATMVAMLAWTLVVDGVTALAWLMLGAVVAGTALLAVRRAVLHGHHGRS